MARRMLIDATHPDESRVAVVDDSILDDYDAESSTKKQFKGNVYLAKVIRVEPSLQAAFVEYGHNRHGFLPFSEIHPDYYRIPVGDRSAEESIVTPSMPSKATTDVASIPSEIPESTSEISTESASAEIPDFLPSQDTEVQPTEDLVIDEQVELGDEDDSVVRRNRPYRYKIQEVIKRRQILLIQVVKEERGNKGAALTTYLSLPGRYCVLMPNAGHRSGGISRKIADTTDRKRLRDILNDLPIPDGISLIVRTAGQDRNKVEIRRDFEYLIRLWSEIREKTLTSIAPALVYAEGDLIKRSIRDNYDKEVSEIVVEGEEGYKAAKSFMRTLIPSHAKKVKLYKEQVPLFQKYNVETQVDAIMSPVATLPSGGSIVINLTEALVAVDVNSGKSTRERHIDDTAIKTNLEAAVEVARQMRLRDLAGLIVVDFIDMSDPKHIASVEKKLRESVRQDRARIQVGKISNFGLLEMSRQRLRPSIVESNMRPCTHCHGTGMVRSIESMALLILRGIESAGLAGKSAEIVVTVPSGVDLYLLNQKRTHIVLLEKRYDMSVMVQRDDSLIPPDYRLDTLVDREEVLKVESIKSSVAVTAIDSEPANPVRVAPIDQESDATDEQSGEEGGRTRSHLRQRRGPFQNRRRNKGEHRSDRSQEESQGSIPVKAEEVVPVQSPQEVQVAESTPDAVTEKVASKEGSNRRNNRRRGNRLDKKNREGQAPSTETPITQVLETEQKAFVPEDAENRQPSSEKSERDTRRGNRRPRPRRDASRDRPSESTESSPESKVESKPIDKAPEKTTESKVGSRKEEKNPSAGGDKVEKPKSSPFLSPQPILDPTGLMFSDDKPVKKKKKGFWSRLLEV